jgi:hypothetical protein
MRAVGQCNSHSDNSGFPLLFFSLEISRRDH